MRLAPSKALAIFLIACGAQTTIEAIPHTPTGAVSNESSSQSWEHARSVFETRCVVCHGCYDAPCQLKLGSYDGITRGATVEQVYESTRLVASEPTRLGIDAHDVATWRKKGFHSVLADDSKASLIERMLDLKRDHPITESQDIAKDFTLDLNRKQTCTTIDHVEDFAKSHPLWGMPYALPGLDAKEQAALVDWIRAGAPFVADPPVSGSIANAITTWETFLNESPFKNQLAARYVYEHLFLASIRFDDSEPHVFFRLVRSRTPSGTAVDEISTRRPFDDPGTPRVYYRFVRRDEGPLEKTHMPYALTPAKLKRVHELFIDPPYVVDRLPSYAASVAANPFRAFHAIPAASRYRFMLDEAEFTMMGFIKGPVCRGQVALNVIEDRFWITFLSPDIPWMNDETAFLASETHDLDMPAKSGSTAIPTMWLAYASEHAAYVRKRTAFMDDVARSAGGLDLKMIWDGEGHNDNAALTVFRHFDSATIVKGFVGSPTKTSWVIGYPLLERIHYLLVAGFDVFGNVTHQVTTRLYMDFLRMEGEANYLMFLPSQTRGPLVDRWYRNVKGDAKQHVTRELLTFTGAPRIPYRTRNPQTELDAMLATRLAPIMSHGFDLTLVEDAHERESLTRLGRVVGNAASWMPEMSFVNIEGHNFTVLRDSGHTNVDELFFEDDRRVKTEDALVVVRGFLGAYPNALFDVSKKDLDAFVDAVSYLDGADSYHAFRARFGVLRSSDHFWSFSDRIMRDHARDIPTQPGMFDYNRLEAF